MTPQPESLTCSTLEDPTGCLVSNLHLKLPPTFSNTFLPVTVKTLGVILVFLLTLKTLHLPPSPSAGFRSGVPALGLTSLQPSCTCC